MAKTDFYSITSFFDSGENGYVGPPQPPKIINARLNNKGRIIMAAGGSFIATTATISAIDPNTGRAYGPFTLFWDETGTQLVGMYDGNSVQPAGSIRAFIITNPNGLKSNTVRLTR